MPLILIIGRKKSMVMTSLSKFGRLTQIAFICILLLSTGIWQTVHTQTILKEWKTDDGQTLHLNDNILGKSFLFTQDTLRITGNWIQTEKSIQFTPMAVNRKKITEAQLSLLSDLPNPQSIATDTTLVQQDTLQKAIALSPPIFPKTLYIQKLTEENLNLIGNSNSYQFYCRDEKSMFAKIIDNNILRGIIGILSLVLICFVLSKNRRKIDWRLVITGIVIQIIFALLVLKVPPLLVKLPFMQAAIDISPRAIFSGMAYFFVAVLDFTSQGAQFVFGGLVTDMNKFGFIFAFKVLPTVIFFSALSSALYYLGILQKIVFVFAWIMSKTMRLSGAESLSAAANIFIGQTEAPLLVKPYIERMTRSEILCLMVGGMATIAGGVFAAYVGFLGGDDPALQLLFATHLLSASIMSAPAAIVASKMLLPQTEEINTNLDISQEKIGSNLLDAIAVGTTDGLKLAVNVGAMLLVFIAMMAMLNSILFDLIGHYTGINDWIASASHGKYAGLKLEYIFGFLFAPLAWLCGTPGPDIVSIGQLLGEKTIINEFVAYGTLGNMKDLGIITNSKSLIIAIYALCGFSNVGSIGIQLGGIGAIAPGQRHTLAHLGVYALIGGTIACLFTAVIAGMITG